MFRRLTEEDKPKLMEFLFPEKEVNTFIIGDIESFGFEGPQMWVEANIGEDSSYDSVVLFFHKNVVVYGKAGFDARAVADFLATIPVFGIVNGKEEVLKQLAPYLPGYGFEGFEFACCRKEDFVPIAENPAVRLAPEDARKIGMLENSIEEFKRNDEITDDRIKGLEYSLKHEKNISCGIFDGSELVSSAGISGIYSLGAMAVGVCTKVGYRGRGYATYCIKELQKVAFQEKDLSFICLFFDNPIAGGIYLKAGFKVIGRYAMLREIKTAK